ncbi:MAG: hypothetical protein ABH807_03280 [Candidatus Shapirobacteria bacterium]
MDDLNPPISTTNNLDRLEDHFKEEITAVNLASPLKKFPVKKIVSILLGILIVVAIPAAVILVKQRQELRKEAIGEPCSETKTWNDPACFNICDGHSASRSCNKPGTLGSDGVCHATDVNWCKDGDLSTGWGDCSCPTPAAPGSGNAGDIQIGIDGCTVKYKNIGASPTSWTGTAQVCQSKRNTLEECNTADDRLECRNSGEVQLDSGLVAPGAETSQGVCQIACGIYQVDITGIVSDHGCNWDSSCDRPTITPTPTPTGRVTVTPTPTTIVTLTPTPTSTRLSCQSTCDANSNCGDSLTCYDFGNNAKRCVDSRCPNESDCVCNKSCYELCSGDSECPSGLVCRTIDSVKRCVNPSCERESDCDCSLTTGPIPTTVQLPAAGFTLPTWGSVAGGIGLIVASLLLLL